MHGCMYAMSDLTSLTLRRHSGYARYRRATPINPNKGALRDAGTAIRGTQMVAPGESMAFSQ